MTNQTLADIRSRRSVKKYTDQPVPMELKPLPRMRDFLYNGDLIL